MILIQILITKRNQKGNRKTELPTKEADLVKGTERTSLREEGSQPPQDFNSTEREEQDPQPQKKRKVGPQQITKADHSSPSLQAGPSPGLGTQQGMAGQCLAYGKDSERLNSTATHSRPEGRPPSGEPTVLLRVSPLSI